MMVGLAFALWLLLEFFGIQLECVAVLVRVLVANVRH